MSDLRSPFHFRLTQPDSNQQGPIAGLTTSDLVRDAHRGTAPGTFRVALPDGDYSVHATIGGVGDHQGLSLVANGTPVVSNMPLKHGKYIETTFNVTVSGGLLDLTFSHNDGDLYDRHWTVSGLEIVPLNSLLPITPTANFGAIDANGSTLTTITASVPGERRQRRPRCRPTSRRSCDDSTLDNTARSHPDHRASPSRPQLGDRTLRASRSWDR